jgi:hypothetical protein
VDIVAIVYAGIIATAALTLVLYLGYLLGLPEMDMVGLTGTMITPNRGAAYLVGTLSHFSVGVLMAVLYAWLWNRGVGEPNWWWGLFYGAIHGLIAVVLLPMLLRLHPQRLVLTSEVGAAVSMILSHLIYGLLVAVLYGVFAGVSGRSVAILALLPLF